MPKMMAIARVGILVARNAPTMAPSVVATSRNIPIRMLEKPSLTYAAAAPEDVAITDTSEAPIAYRISTLKNNVSSGTSTTPPPSPVRAPSSPAANEPTPTSKENSQMLIPNHRTPKEAEFEQLSLSYLQTGVGADDQPGTRSPGALFKANQLWIIGNSGEQTRVVKLRKKRPPNVRRAEASRLQVSVDGAQA